MSPKSSLGHSSSSSAPFKGNDKVWIETWNAEHVPQGSIGGGTTPTRPEGDTRWGTPAADCPHATTLPARTGWNTSPKRSKNVRGVRRTGHKEGSPRAPPAAQSWNWLPDGPEDNSGWFVPTPYADLRGWEKQGFVDRQKDVIPFWRKGVDAADRGEDAEKWEHFLDELERKYNDRGAWGVGSDEWGQDGGEGVWGFGEAGSRRLDGSWGEGEAAWGLPVSPVEHVDSRRRNDSSKRKRRRKNQAPGRDSWTFVEEVARQEDATAERKRRMHEFYEMPTQQKVQQIRNIIRGLQV